MIKKRKGLLWPACVLLCSLAVCRGQTSDSDLSAHWLPTDLNYVLLSQLSNTTIKTLDQQIAGYSILGTVTLEDVATWLHTFQTNSNARTGTVRWNPTVASKCNSGTLGCTKSIEITVLEFSYNNPNGSDCQAKATIGAQAILPPVAFLNNPATGASYLPSRYPVQYSLEAAPNATASDCTYVITYPQATQTLANSLCGQGNASCTNSPCVPCNANQTLTGSSSPPTDCTPTSGVAPGLVAAIEGAALCLSVGGMGSFQCQVAFASNNSACSNMHCFPGDATVRLEGGKTKAMEDVRIGDRVQVVHDDGRLGFEDVYFFGHREKHAVANFVRLELATRLDRLERHLDLSSHHFALVKRSQTGFLPVRAKDVRVGDELRISSAEGVFSADVVSISRVTKQGLWNPYTLGGTIVVNDVVASAHSEWIFDPLFDWLDLTHHLPAFYQMLLAPVRAVYQLLGPQQMQKLDHSFNFGSLLTSINIIGKSQ